MSNLTTLPNVKAWLKITGNNTDDDLLNLLISGASAFIQSWLSRDLASAEYTEQRDGNGAGRMCFANYPVTAVASVKINNVSIPAAPDCTRSGYMFDNTCLTVRGYRFDKGMNNISISYTAGYEVVPADVAQACMELVGKKYRERDRIGQTSKTIGAETVSFSPSDLSKEMKSVLNNYQKVVPI